MTLVIAHRGASAYAPENTMPAFELAVRQGADMMELDVQRSADGAIVVFHDELTERWDGRRRRTTDCTLAELQALNIGGARVPTLAEVCDLARERQVRLNVELKGLGIAADVARVLRDTRAEELTLVSCFAVQGLAEMAAAAPHIPRGYLMGTHTLRPRVRFRESWPFRALKAADVSAWHPAFQLPLLGTAIPRVRRAGYQVHVWTVNNPRVMRRLIQLGVSGIITDTPDVLRAILSERTPQAQARR
ncbi:MAG TPA: glycerophosphodiester phosphodiesterase family protein [Roseiflexaceae bacterium]|nr:glycerophosphodiester phosphodiesterase family protein [Roseiflexaceae bacterium]